MRGTPGNDSEMRNDAPGDGGNRSPAGAALPATLRDELRTIFADRSWGYHERADLSALICELSGALGHWVLVVQIDEGGRIVAFYSVLPVTVAAEHRAAMAAFLTRINYGLSLGSFELDFRDGEVRCKIMLPVGDGPLSEELVDRCIRAGGRLCELYLPHVEAVAAGDDPGPSVPVDAGLDRSG